MRSPKYSNPSDRDPKKGPLFLANPNELTLLSFENWMGPENLHCRRSARALRLNC